MSAGDVEDAVSSLLIKVEEESKNSHYLPLVRSLVKAVFTSQLINRSDCKHSLNKVTQHRTVLVSIVRVNNIPSMLSSAGIPRKIQSNSYLRSLTGLVWELQYNALWNIL